MITPDATMAQSAAELLGLCRAIDAASAEQLEELADSFAMSNNRDGAGELVWLAEWKTAHAEGIAAPPTAGIVDWYCVDPGDPEALHYLMWPWHLVGVALDNESRMRDLFLQAGRDAADPAIKAAAQQLVARQDANIAELEARRRTLPEPPAHWDDDPDPPFFDQ